MTNVVVDASVAIKWFLPETDSEAASRLLRTDWDLAAPDLLLVECANVLWKHVSFKELAAATAQAILRDLTDSPLHVHPSAPLVEAALEMACRFRRTAYDCLYLALAMTLDAPLVTADRRFFDALHRTSLGKSLLWVGDLQP